MFPVLPHKILQAKDSVGGRVKDAAAKKEIAKNIGDMGEPALMNLESGAFKPKKQKKEKTPIEIAAADLKAFEKKTLNCNRICLPVYVAMIRFIVWDDELLHLHFLIFSSTASRPCHSLINSPLR